MWKGGFLVGQGGGKALEARELGVFFPVFLSPLLPGKHRKVITLFLGNWIAGFGGFKLMGINSNLVFQVFFVLLMFGSRQTDP